MTEDLHPSRLRILEFLARRDPTEGPPAVREVAEAVGLRSTQTVHHHLLKLEEDGYIDRGSIPGRKRRPLRLTDKGWDAVSTRPLLGRIAAGRGLEAMANEEPYSLAAELLAARPGSRRFLLEARGDSMTGAGIEEGDTLVVEENPSPPDGSVVAALILDREEEATVKVLRRQGETIRLEARNGAHEDIVVPADRVVVQGTVEWVIRRVRGRR
ncbi:MAG TPA: transcriptional repressor LexA [Rubrobacteraceae bacterium]|nr:transcriptional repressor LexA [Rubrobacteraceae bacterium]